MHCGKAIRENREGLKPKRNPEGLKEVPKVSKLKGTLGACN
jgi:hypothetical protein